MVNLSKLSFAVLLLLALLTLCSCGPFGLIPLLGGAAGGGGGGGGGGASGPIPPPNPALILHDQSNPALTSYTNSLAVDIGVTGLSASVTHFILDEITTGRPDAGAPGWQLLPIPASYTFAGPGLKTLYLWVKSDENLVNNGIVSAQIEVDMTPPMDPSLTLRDRTTSDPDLTDEQTVDVEATNIDADVVEYIFSETQATTPSELSADWDTNHPSTFDLSAGEALKTVYLWVKDNAGNICANAGIHQIAYNTAAIDDPLFHLEDLTTNSSQYSNATTVALVLTSIDVDATYYLINETQSTQPLASDPGWTAMPLPATFDLGGTGVRTVYMWLKDDLGAINPNPAPSQIEVDMTAPGTPALTLSDQSSGDTAHTNDPQVDVATSGIDADVTQFILSESHSTTPAEDDLSWTAVPIWGVYTCTGGDGDKTAYLWLKDQAGNVCDNPGIHTIELDTAVNTPTLALQDQDSGSPSWCNETIVDVVIGSLDPDIVEYIISETIVAAPAVDAPEWSSTQPVTYTFDSATEEQKTVYLWVKDDAENITGTSAQITYDGTDPTASAAPGGGSFAVPVTVTLTASDLQDPSPAIYYTTDSSAPDTSSALYSAPIDIAVDTTLKFITEDAAGNQSGIYQEDYAITSPAPVADFTATPTLGPAPLTVTFTDNSSGIVTAWDWDFDNDGTTDSNLQDTPWTYSSPGRYTVTLTVNGPGGSDSITKVGCIAVADVTYNGTAGVDEWGTALTVADGALFFSGIGTDWNSGTVGRYALPLKDGAQPVWSHSWPTTPQWDSFEGIAAGPDAIYVVGASYTQTDDGSGGKEGKCAILKYPFTGSTPIWYSWYRNLGGGTAIEYLMDCAIAVEGGNTYIYGCGMAQYPNKDMVLKVIDPQITGPPEGAGGGTEDFAPVQPGWPQFFTTVENAGGDGIVMLDGYAYAVGHDRDDGTMRPIIAKYKTDGTQVWVKRGAGDYPFSGMFTEVTAYHGALYAVGCVENGTGGSRDFLIEKRDQDGNPLWLRQYDRNSEEDYLYNAVGLDGRIYAVGYTRGFTAGGADAIILEIDPATGDLLASHLYGGTSDDMARGVATDGLDLYVTGETQSFGPGGKDMFLLRVPGLRIYVDGINGDDTNNGYSWSQALKTIQKGIDIAQDGWVVLVADGTYTGVGNKDLDFGGKVIWLKSENGPASCIIDCELSGRGFYFHSGETNAAIVEGFTIRNGNIAGNGSGVYCWDSSPTIINCIIRDNQSGLAYSGGGIYSDWSNPTITNCKIINNSAGWGGGIFCSNFNPMITNCTIVNNTSTAAGGGIYCGTNSILTLNNTIIWSNVATTDNGHQLFITDSGSSVTLKYCDYADGANDIAGSGTFTPDANCITLDPEFVNASAQDYHLQGISPCIDAGDNTVVTWAEDLDGNPRVRFDAVDIGAYEWPEVTFAKTWGGISDDYISSVTADSTGNIYAAGYTDSFGAGDHDGLLLKYDSAGTLQWARTWGGVNVDRITDVAVDSAGSVYAVGSTDSFGAGNWDALILKYDSSGALLWARTWGGGSDDSISGVAVDSTGNIYVTGMTWSFGAGQYDALLLKYDSSGVLQWARTWGGGDYDYTACVAVDSAGNIYTGGYSFNLGASAYDAVILKYNSSGTLQWARTWNNDGTEVVRDITVDSDDNIYAAGTTSYSFGPGWGNGFLLRINSSGTVQWAKTWGGDNVDQIRGVAVDSAGYIYTAGWTENFGAGGYDALVLKYDSSGTVQWAKTWGGSGIEYMYDIAVDSSNNIILGGWTESYTGVWQEVTTGTETTPAGATNSSATEGTPTGTESNPIGTETSPTGDESGAGLTDTLLLKNW